MSGKCFHASWKTFNCFRRQKKNHSKWNVVHQEHLRYQIDNNVIRMLRQNIFEPTGLWNQNSQKQLFWSASRIFVRRVARRCLKCCDFNWEEKEEGFLKPNISIMYRVDQKKYIRFHCKNWNELSQSFLRLHIHGAYWILQSAYVLRMFCSFELFSFFFVRMEIIKLAISTIDRKSISIILKLKPTYNAENSAILQVFYVPQNVIAADSQSILCVGRTVLIARTIRKIITSNIRFHNRLFFFCAEFSLLIQTYKHFFCISPKQ